MEVGLGSIPIVYLACRLLLSQDVFLPISSRLTKVQLEPRATKISDVLNEIDKYLR